VRAPLVLLADHSPEGRDVLREALEAHGYALAEAEDGEQALAVAEETRPDVILLDLDAPALHGREVLASLAQHRDLSTVPVVVLTAITDVDAVVDLLSHGAHDYLTKPFAPADLVARVSAALRIKQVNDELRRRNTQLSAFAWRASHDLKSPLAVIRGVAETLVLQGSRLDPPTRDDLLNRAARAADQAAKMVDDLLSLAKAGAAPATDPELTPDPEAVVRAAVDTLGVADADLHLAGSDWAPVAVPAPDLATIVARLVENAAWYGRSADGVLRLSLTAAVVLDTLELSVEDQGPGVAPGDVPHVFEPFHRGAGASARNPHATGIGLAVVRRILDRWGGRIELSSPPDRGATFRVVLPLGKN
jgi:two-component system sensor histidine kinase/response regulator